MTPQEEQLVRSLVERVNKTQLEEKDPDAEALLNRALAGNPDALYILAQTVLVQNIALDQAKAQIAQLQQARQPAHASSFLGNLLGHRDPQPAPPPYQPMPQYAPPEPVPYAQPQYAAAGPPSFLRGAMQTAAGVAAGALAFEGVEAVLHGLGGHSGYGMGGFGMGPGIGMMGGGFERPVEETVINNNYFDDPGAQGAMEHHGLEHGAFEQGGPHAHEPADQNGAQLSDAAYNTSGDERDVNDSGDSASDNSSDFDDSGTDDGSGFDDGGGGDLL